MSTSGQQASPQQYTPPPPIARPVGWISDEERIFAAAAHGLSFFEGGILGPAVVYFLKKEESEFVAFHALQSLYFGVAFLVLTLVTCGLAALVLVWPYLIYEAIAALKAYEGEWYELPVAGRYARARHGPGSAS